MRSLRPATNVAGRMRRWAILALIVSIAAAGIGVWMGVSALSNGHGRSVDFAWTPSTPSVNQTVTLTATFHGGPKPTEYDWTFGDGATGTGQIVTHAFAAVGSYVVSVIATGGSSVTANASHTLTLVAAPPPALQVTFTYAPTNPVDGESIAFSGSSTGGTPPVSFAWTFGDATTGTGANVTHAYTSAGTYTVTLTGQDAAGTTATTSASVVVASTAPSPLTAGFTFAPTNPQAGTAVDFTATASGGTPPYSFAWDFGDGSTGSGASVAHAYASAGSYSVTLTVADSGGQSTSVVETVAVSAPAPAPLAASFVFSPASPAAGQTVTFSGTASGGSSPYAYAWDFGDGSTSSGSSTSHAYTASGTYTVTLTVNDAAGNSTSVAQSVVVSATAPPPPSLSAAFTVSPTAPSTGQTVFMNATAAGGAPPYTFAWAFGDGQTATGADVSCSFGTAGTFTVNLTVADSGGNMTWVDDPVTVSAATPPLAASFTFSPASPTAGQTVTFSAVATGGVSPFTYAWNFGDGATGSGASATHAYSAAGTYTVGLTITDSASQTAKASQSVTVASGTTSSSAFDYVVTIIMENHAICDVMTTCGGSGTYMTGLAQTYGLATGYVDCSSPSLPNYFCLTGGTDFGCGGYDGSPNSNTCTANAWGSQNIVDRLTAAGKTWKAYMEDMPSDCYGSNSGNYAVRHDPFVYYSDIVTNPSRCALVVPAGSGDSALLNDLASTSTASNYMWLTPNVCNDMHDCGVSTGDAYLANLVPQILGSNVFKTGRAALFITFDEDSGGSGAPNLYTVWAGPGVKAGFSSSASYDHFAYLATIEANFGLASLTSNDAGATPMAEFFTAPLVVSGVRPAASAVPSVSTTASPTWTLGTTISTETWDAVTRRIL